MNISKPYNNVFEALEDDPVEAENLKLRAKMMAELRDYIKQNNMLQTQAARFMGVTQSQINDLLCGEIDAFTIDILINMLIKSGIHVDFEMKKAS
ncbi:XRE family transcriptional regulator [Candidatus Magnetomoraceae bacterium gMMP-15]